MRIPTALLFCGCLLLAGTPSWAQGYSGLFAPADDGKTAAPTATAGPDAAGAEDAPSVNHILAPAPAPANRRAAVKKEAPVTTGYSGLIAGTPADAPKTSRAAEKAKEKITEKAGQISKPVKSYASANLSAQGAEPKTIVSSKDLKRAAFFERLRDEGIGSKKHELPPGWGPIVEKSLLDKNGKSDTERMIDDRVRRAMEAVNDPKLSAEARKQKARDAYEQLLNTGDGLLALNKASAVTFKRYGVSDDTIDERKQSNSRALTTLQEALHQLKDMQ